MRELCDAFPRAGGRTDDSCLGTVHSWGEGDERMAESEDSDRRRQLANCELLEAYLADLDCEVAMAVDGQDTLDKVGVVPVPT